MVYRRYKRKYTKRTYRKKAVTRNRNISYITRTLETTAFNIPATTNTWAVQNYSFRLGSLPAFGELVSVFDQYKITKIKVTFFPRYRDQTLGQGTSAVATPHIWLCPNSDDSSIMGSQLAAMQVQKARMIRDPYKPFSVTFKPKFLSEVKVGVGITAGHSQTGWLDTDNNQVLHYGCTIAGDTPAVGTTSFSTLFYDCFATYYMQFKDPI